MKTAKEYHVFVDKQTRKIIGKTIDVPSSMEDRFEEIELPESFKKMIDKVNEWKNKNNN